ncbi:MAG TPA: hypothetical protein VM925_17230, partial [Labilithrix sp.]|nr:hypothetical protein [Labilithrix sp.]
MSYEDAEAVPRAVHDVLGDVPLVGGSAGARVLGTHGVASRGVSIVLLGGDGIEVATRTAV